MHFPVAKYNKNTENIEVVDRHKEPPYEHCLNCGTELQGKYCHHCGQEAVNKTPTVVGFLMAYLDNAFMWDSQFLKTLWNLIRRPGHLTAEYNEGRFVSQEHPLKLNMFLLFVFISLFVFFASEEKLTNSVYNITNDERVVSAVQLNFLMEDPQYAKKVQESPRDTILLYAPLVLSENFPQIISNIRTIEDTKGKALDKWEAIFPRVLIEDKFVVIDDNGYYRFHKKKENSEGRIDLVNSVVTEMIRIASQYFPIILLLTAPFLAFSLNLIQRRSRIPRINHFIFALHYTAFLEFMMLCIYILYLTVAPPMNLLQNTMIVGSCIYLIFAYRRVYATSWIKSIVKSLLTSFIYLIMLLMIFVAIFIVACVIVANMS